MKYFLISLFSFFTCSLFAQHQAVLIGKWHGLLDVGMMELRVDFNFKVVADSMVVTMDSPDQKAFDIPVDEWSFSNGELILKLPQAQIEYKGKYEKEKISGNFRQAGQSHPLELGRNEVVKTERKRSQTIKEPIPYVSEDIVFKNKKAGIELAGTLTYPHADKPVPAVVMISGSGPQNRNEELLGHQPFLIIADYLSRKGIAVLRFDDRGVGQSKGEFHSATSYDFSTDAESAVQYLKNRKEIDKKRIGLAGHSEGGIIAPMVAVRNKDVAFIILLAGTGIRGDQLLLLQQELIARANGEEESEIQKMKAINTKCFEIIVRNTDKDKMVNELRDTLNVLADRDHVLDIPTGMNKNMYINQIIFSSTSTWMLYFIRHDPALVLKKVKCPVFILNGDKDLQVPAKENVSAIEAALQSGGNKHYQSKIYPGLNHLFQHCTTGSPNEYNKIEETFSEEVMGDMVGFIFGLPQGK